MEREKFNTSVNSEFKVFKKEIMEKGVLYVFNNAYEINKMASLRDYLTEREDSFVEGLYPYTKNILNELYTYEMDYDVPMYTNWDDIDKMIADFVEEKKQKGEQR